ncbi:hypothetical protein FNH22_30445 [Fulvivirga sp. M361]|uniref:hypothetical protein n=1 Tax=Fulvivirga sp. M361 TaxID=2594266 RepID=UPI001179D85C|nr:hypothetical protein [Fulvivirga sp. M361]TRX47141.1 hypothetical protein FNH22_30445 [Fulvivirga sp. M361]
MKHLLALFFLFLSFSLFAQNKETHYKPISYDSFKEYPRLTYSYVYHDITDQFVKVNTTTDFMNFTSPTIGNASVNGSWMGSKQVSSFQFMNRNIEVHYIYDNNGVLRESSFSLPFFGKKRSHSIRYINTQ